VANDAQNLMEGAGRVRDIRARWVVEGTLRLETAACFGGGNDDAADIALLRDHEEKPLLPGTSLAGALRSHLADVCGGYGSPEHDDVARLFGVAKRKGGEEGDPGYQSPVIVFDSRAMETPDTEIRDGVAIDSGKGTAEKHKKFDAELLAPGTRFPLRVDLVLEQRHGSGDDLISLLATALEGLSDGSISLGTRRSRGLGHVSVQSWKAHRFDLDSQDGWMRWLATDPEDPLATCGEPWRVEKLAGDHRRRFVADLALQLDGPILIGAPSATGPDVGHLTSGGESILSGTSLAGALRNRALRIARAVRNSEGDQWVDRLFGPRFEGTSGASVEPRASRLRVSESAMKDAARLQTVRIAIDRFTNAPVDGALLEEEASYCGTMNVRLEIRNPNKGEAGLILLVLKDLLTGDLPLGGTVGAGRGLVNGTASVALGSSRWQIDPEREADERTVAGVNALVRELHDVPFAATEEVSDEQE